MPQRLVLTECPNIRNQVHKDQVMITDTTKHSHGKAETTVTEIEHLAIEETTDAATVTLSKTVEVTAKIDHHSTAISKDHQERLKIDSVGFAGMTGMKILMIVQQGIQIVGNVGRGVITLVFASAECRMMKIMMRKSMR